MEWVDSFQDCVDLCDETDGCIDVSLSGTACYMKSSLGAAIAQEGILGAKSLRAASTPTPTPQDTGLICPMDNNTIYTAPSGQDFQIECGIDHVAGDLSMDYVDSFQDCIDLCDKTDGCLDVSLSGSACYMKSILGRAIADDGNLGAKLIGAKAPVQCPTSDGTNYTTSNDQTFVVECGIDHAGGDIRGFNVAGDIAARWLGQCIETCGNTTGCVDVSLSGRKSYSPCTPSCVFFENGVLI